MLTILLNLPRVARNVFLAYRGAPVLRINELGLWARGWSSLGWISWRDVASVRIVGGRNGTFHEIEIRLCDEEFARLASPDRASVMLARVIAFLLSINEAPNTLRPTNLSRLTS